MSWFSKPEPVKTTESAAPSEFEIQQATGLPHLPIGYRWNIEDHATGPTIQIERRSEDPLGDWNYVCGCGFRDSNGFRMRDFSELNEKIIFDVALVLRGKLDREIISDEKKDRYIGTYPPNSIKD